VRGIRALILVAVCGPVQADSLSAAREHYRDATKAYEVGDYETAIREFADAYKLKDDPTILFNLGQAHRLAGHKLEALRAYRNYLNRVPNAANRDEVKQLIEALTAPADDPDTEVARRLFEHGAAEYNARRYEEAIAAFEKARTVRPTAALDYNIGRSYDRLGKSAEALTFYRRYVASTPAPPDAAEVRERIETLERRLPAAANPPAPTVAPVAQPPPTAAPAERKKSRRWVVPVAIAGVVAVGLAVGLGVGLGVGPSDPNSTLAPVHWK
jgi:tetratricopeptide (TPR) repeat protein